ncbi:MAG: Os1348 family NHLP clan protein [Anaerolineae bacterium]
MTISLQQAIHRAVTDAHFRARLLADPRAAIASLGLTLDDEELAVLMEMRHLFARHAATWLSGQGYGDPTGRWFGGRPVIQAALAQGQ